MEWRTLTPAHNERASAAGCRGPGGLRQSGRPTRGHLLRFGTSTRFYRVENYESVLPSLPGSSRNYARFVPSTASGYAGVSLRAADIIERLGLGVMPWFELGISFPSARGRTMVQLSYALLNARGVKSGAFDDPRPGITERRQEFRLGLEVSF